MSATGIVYTDSLARITVESNSPMLIANANAAPATTPGHTSGNSTSHSARPRLAPSARADSTTRLSTAASIGATFRTTNG